MNQTEKSPALAATSGEAPHNAFSDCPHYNAPDALRKSFLWRLSNLNIFEKSGHGGVYYGQLVGHGARQGFTKAQARQCIEALAADGLATFHVSNSGRVVVREGLA